MSRNNPIGRTFYLSKVEEKIRETCLVARWNMSFTGWKRRGVLLESFWSQWEPKRVATMPSSIKFCQASVSLSIRTWLCPQALPWSVSSFSQESCYVCLVGIVPLISEYLWNLIRSFIIHHARGLLLARILSGSFSKKHIIVEM